MMYYFDSSMRNAPELRLGNAAAFKDLFVKLFRDGIEAFKPDAVNGQKLTFNAGLPNHDLLKFVLFDANKKVITKLEKLNNNEFVAVEDISDLSVDFSITYPKPDGFAVEELPDGVKLSNEFGGFQINQSNFQSSHGTINATGFRGSYSFPIKGGFSASGQAAGYAVIYGDNGLVILNNQNSSYQFFTMLLNEEITIYNDAPSNGVFNDSWNTSLIKASTDNKYSLSGFGNTQQVNNPLYVASAYFGGYPSFVLKTFFGTIPLPPSNNAFMRLPIATELGDYAVVKRDNSTVMIFYMGD